MTAATTPTGSVTLTDPDREYPLACSWRIEDRAGGSMVPCDLPECGAPLPPGSPARYVRWSGRQGPGRYCAAHDPETCARHHTGLADRELLARAIEASGLSARQFARRVAWANERSVRGWLAGRSSLPDAVREGCHRVLAWTPRQRQRYVRLAAME